MGTEILTTLRGKKGLRDGSWKKGDFRDGP